MPSSVPSSDHRWAIPWPYPWPLNVKDLLDGTATDLDDVVDDVDVVVDAVLAVELLVVAESVVADTTEEYAPRAVPSDLSARTWA